ncbi:Extra-large guanine nucleotide-binding protein 2 [Cardamine amara subsp. amara]|uniref:Extra-large guanine nucleotide-binding protein 2 n=1 Tax=Cardamine amara subsp. amara TaxID=228776 RepID=A0ABD1BG18_CARAN
MATVLRKLFPLTSPSPKMDNRDSDDDDEASSSYRIEYSFASEYKGPLIANLPRALPVEVDEIPTAQPVSFSSLSRDISYPVVQPIVRTNRVTKKPPESGSEKKKKNGLVDSEGSSSVVLIGRDVVSGSSSTSLSSSKRLDVSEEAKSSVELPLSPSSSSSVEVREEDTFDDAIVSDVGSGSIREEADGERENHVRFVEPIQSSECDESSFISDGESFAPMPKAERKGKRGSCYRCLMGNRFTEKEVCIVCDAKYCSNCVRRAMGAMPEGRKCQTCIGIRIDESKRGSLGKCSRMLKRVLTDSELRQVMSDEISCRVNQLPSRLIVVNDMPLSEDDLYKLQTSPNPPKKLNPGFYWYDKVAGYWGKVGEKPCQIISPQLNIGDNIKENASNGDTEVLINNREITRPELMMLKLLGVQCEGKPHFWLDSSGTYREEGQKHDKGNIWNKKRTKLVCAMFSLPVPPASSAVEPSDEPLYEQKMLNKLLLIGNEKSGATTIYKQARSLYDVPFSVDDRERIKFIIQTNLYAYLAMVLEAHERFEEEMSNNQSPDRTGNTGDETSVNTVSSINPRLKHFSDWLLKEKKEGNLKIFPPSSRENAQNVADLWRLPAVQATYKRLRDTLPRSAVYFLGRILDISRSEYEPSDMDILQAEGLSSMEGLSCVEFSFPPTSQEETLESDYQHDPDTKYQLIRLNPRGLGENWKWLEMFEDADLVIFCVSLTDYGEYIEDGNGVLVNKMIANRQLFKKMVKHPSLAKKRFLLVLTKFDLLEEKVEEVPLRTCEWFKDFNPLVSQNQTSRHNPPMAQRAFHYIGFEFKRFYDKLVAPISMRGRSFRPKLFVAEASLESETVDNALRYAREILKWHVEENSMFQEMSTTSISSS